MASFHHPSELNPLQRYSQACAILRSTSRASNEAWYKEALDLDFQLHLRADGVEVLCSAYNRKTGQWTKGPALDDDTLRSTDKSISYAAEIIAFAQKNGATSVGVILHVADEFATTELKPEFNNPGALNDLRAAAETDPGSILDDSSIPQDQNTWRVLPYPAAGSEAIATTITLTRSYAPFMDQLRLAGENANYPIITQALSAPLVTLLAIPRTVQPTEGRSFMTVFQYAMFTVLAFFNEHGDLRLIRTLQHRGARRPSNLRHAASTTTAALEFVDPDIILFPLASQADPGLAADLRVVFPSSRVQEVDWSATVFSADGLPAHAPESMVVTLPPDSSEQTTSLSHTFSVFQSERWAIQNFLSTPKEVSEIYPTRGEMKILRAIRLIRIGIAACAVLALAWALFGIIDIIRKPEWTFDPTEAKAVQQRLGGLNSQNQKVEHWDNLLEDRSKAWASMELLSRLFPDRGGVMVKNFVHTVKPDVVPGQAKVGFVKEWKISGFAREEAVDRLNSISTREGVSSAFSEIARITGNPAFSTDSFPRSLISNVRMQENPGFKPRPADEVQDDDPLTYPIVFDLTITQRFEAADPLAVNVSKAP